MIPRDKHPRSYGHILGVFHIVPIIKPINTKNCNNSVYSLPPPNHAQVSLPLGQWLRVIVGGSQWDAEDHVSRDKSIPSSVIACEVTIPVFKWTAFLLLAVTEEHIHSFSTFYMFSFRRDQAQVSGNPTATRLSFSNRN